MRKVNVKPTVSKEWYNAIFKEYVEVLGEGIHKTSVLNVQAVAERIVQLRKNKGMSMIIEMRRLKFDKHKEPFSSFSQFKDIHKNVHVGISLGMYPDGNIKWKKTPIGDYKHMDLNNLNDAMVYTLMLLHPKTEGSPLTSQHAAEPSVFLIDPDSEAVIQKTNRQELAEALANVNKIEEVQIVDLARYCNISVSGQVNADILLEKIGDYAIASPMEFNRKFNNKNRSYEELFAAALDQEIISYEHGVGYDYKGRSLGTSQEDAILLLSSEKNLYAEMKDYIDGKDELKNSISGKSNKNKEFKKGNLEEEGF